MGDPEILPPADPLKNQAGYAIDGGIVPAAAMTGGQVIDMLEDGQFSQDVFTGVRDLIAELNDQGANGDKVKGKVTITLDISKEDNAFRIASDVKVVAPKRKRPRSIAWCDEHNRLTRFPPNQMQMFGMKDVGGSGKLRTV